MRWRCWTFCVLLVVLLAPPVWAQTPNIVNPRTVEWTVSDDHAAVASYEVAFFTSATDLTPLNLTDVGKPTPVGTVCTAAINTMPLAFRRDYYARMRAKAPDPVTTGAFLYSEWSDPSNPFDRKPGSPKGVTAKR